MVDRMRKECDVFGTAKDVAPYKVIVLKITTEGPDVVETNVLDVVPVDLSPRAYARLLGLIAKGLKPPTPRKAAEEGGDDAAS